MDPAELRARHQLSREERRRLDAGEYPELGADDAYPDWLWGLIEPRKTLTELEKEVAGAKLSGKYDVMDIEDIKRLVKLRRRAKIKASNAERAK